MFLYLNSSDVRASNQTMFSEILTRSSFLEPINVQIPVARQGEKCRPLDQIFFWKEKLYLQIKANYLQTQNYNSV